MQKALNVSRLEVVGTGNVSQILFAESLGNVGSYLPDRVVVLTDANVHKLYEKLFPEFPVVVVKPGEDSKSLETVAKVYQEMIALGMDRSSFLLSIGGGVVCDLGGFVASTYMRGIKFGFVSTTLLSQVDASVGGKNGINFQGIKNMVGVFSQPEFVICDHRLLKSLPHRERLSGLAEIIKSAVISDAGLFEILENRYAEILKLDEAVTAELIRRSVEIKISIVECDERESGRRRLLNFGHSFGHAIETTYGMTHGEAISQGMLVAVWVSLMEGTLKEEDANRIRNLIHRCGFPVPLKLEARVLMKELLRDKKKENKLFHFVLLNAIGKAFIKPMKVTKLGEYLESYIRVHQ